MLHTLHRIRGSKHLKTLSVTALALGAGLITAFAPVTNVAAVSCRVFTPLNAYYEAGTFRTDQFTVPPKSVSGCLDINVMNIQNTDPRYPNDHCAFFKVGIYNSAGEVTYTPQKFACSTGPNGSVRPLARVPNGTKYHIVYNVETQKPDGSFYRHTFKIVD